MPKRITLLAIIISIMLSSVCGCITEEKHSDSNIIIVDINGGGDYTSIQEAINASLLNCSIKVFDGIYYENIVINKTVVLIGENPENTIIDGNTLDDVISISENGEAAISGFTIRNSGEDRTFPFKAGIKINSNNNTIYGNIIRDNSNGVISYFCLENNFSNNSILSNKKYGMFLYSDMHDSITDNLFSENVHGLRVKGSEYTAIIRNVFKDNNKGMNFCCSSTANVAFLNIFLNNSVWHADDDINLQNEWYNDTIGKGNYWDDYTGDDADGDGIGDTSYNVTADGTIQDVFPLTEPIVYP